MLEIDPLAWPCDVQCPSVLLRRRKEKGVGERLKGALPTEWSWNVWPVVLVPSGREAYYIKGPERRVLEMVKEHLLELMDDRP